MQEKQKINYQYITPKDPNSRVKIGPTSPKISLF